MFIYTSYPFCQRESFIYTWLNSLHRFILFGWAMSILCVLFPGGGFRSRCEPSFIPLIYHKYVLGHGYCLHFIDLVIHIYSALNDKVSVCVSDLLPRQQALSMHSGLPHQRDPARIAYRMINMIRREHNDAGGAPIFVTPSPMRCDKRSVPPGQAGRVLSIQVTGPNEHSVQS